MSLTQQVQQLLIREGFDLGKGGPSDKGDDGIAGRKTLAAIKAWEKKQGLPETGLVISVAKVLDLKSEAPLIAPWFEIALRQKGLHEGKDFALLMQFLRSDGKALGDIRKFPWCGDFVQTPIALALPEEVLPGNPYWARAWADFGVKSPYWPKGSKVKVLGGNQTNSVSITTIDRGRLLASRWPKTHPIVGDGSVGSILVFSRPGGGGHVAFSAESHAASGFSTNEA